MDVLDTHRNARIYSRPKNSITAQFVWKSLECGIVRAIQSCMRKVRLNISKVSPTLPNGIMYMLEGQVEEFSYACGTLRMK